MSFADDFLMYSVSKKNLLIFISVSVLAIHKLVFLITFKINYPYAADTADVFNPIFYLITENKFALFENKLSHLLIFPKIISYPNLALNSFDVGNLFYLQWIVISLTVFVLYLILKQTDKNLVWTLIPISAFLYSPLTTSGYWSATMLSWLFPMLGIVLVVYFLNRIPIHLSTFSLAVFFAIFSTFSIMIGIISWITGLIMLTPKLLEKQFTKKKWFFLWIPITISVGFLYLYLISDSSEPVFYELLFTYTSFSFITNFLASSFRLKFDFLMVFVGTISLVLSGLYVFYFTKKQLIKQYFPWFVLLLTALMGAAMAALGRMQYVDTHMGNDPYYTTISQLFQIGLIVLSGKLIYEFRKPPKTFTKKFVVCLLILLLISQMILLIPSYYSGWERGYHYFEEKNNFFSCYSLSPQINCAYDENFSPIIASSATSDSLRIANYLLEHNLSIFIEKGFNEKNILSLEKFNDYFDNGRVFEDGQITSINGKNVISKSDLFLEEDFVKIDGWFIAKNHLNLENVFLIIDDMPFLEHNHSQIIEIDDESIKVEWSVFFLSGYLDHGCHTVSFVGIFENEKILLDDEKTVCR